MGCFRGQKYCSETCKKKSNQAARKKSNQKYANSPKGKLAIKISKITYINKLASKFGEKSERELTRLAKESKKSSTEKSVVLKSACSIDISSQVSDREINPNARYFRKYQNEGRAQNTSLDSRAPPNLIFVCRVCKRDLTFIQQTGVYA